MSADIYNQMEFAISEGKGSQVEMAMSKYVMTKSQEASLLKQITK